MKPRKYRRPRRQTDSWKMTSLSSKATGVKGVVYVGIEYSKDVPFATTMLPRGELTVTVSDSPEVVYKIGRVSQEVIDQLTAWVKQHHVAIRRHWADITDSCMLCVELGIIDAKDFED